MTELERMKSAVTDIDRHLNGHGGWSYDVVKRIVDKALRPPPEIIEEDVTRWLCLSCGSCYRPEDMHKVEDNQCGACSEQLVRLAGTRKIQKPQPVERSLTVSATVGVDGYTTCRANFGAEASGRSGALTFTWAAPV